MGDHMHVEPEVKERCSRANGIVSCAGPLVKMRFASVRDGKETEIEDIGPYYERGNFLVLEVDLRELKVGEVSRTYDYTVSRGHGPEWTGAIKRIQ